jgi:signal transduction histidine kinase
MLNSFIHFIVVDKSLYFIHTLNIFVLLLLISIFIMVRTAGKKWLKVNDYLGTITKTINSVRYGDLTKKIEKVEIPNSEPLAESLNRMIETLYDREKMVDEYENELNRQNKLLEAVINSLSDGLVILDDNYRILRATKKISEWFNIDGSKLMGDFITDYIQLPTGKKFSNLNENDIIVLNDMASNFVASSMELKLEDKKIRYVLIIKNITDQKELETLKEDFVATLTHDLKVPIIAETNMLDLLLNENFGKISEKQEIALKNMQTSNRELLDLVQIVLETYKFSNQSIRLSRENIMLKGFIEEIISEMRPIADKTKNSLLFNLPRDIRVFADRIQLKRLVKNLIQNAISYGEANSPIEISIGEVPKYIVIKVKDYGKGISEADIKKIFNKYYSAAKKFRKIGTGLGLYLSFQIIKAHGGELNVESIEGEFTEFCIKLPASTSENIYYGE